MELIRAVMDIAKSLQRPGASLHTTIGRIRDDQSHPTDGRPDGPAAASDSAGRLPQDIQLLDTWSSIISSSLITLRRLAGTTEHEFLQIGRELQDVYLLSATLSQTAQNLVEVASGERVRLLLEQLRQILSEMETYLEQTQAQSSSYGTTFNTVETLLNQIGEPLESFKNMSKNLYILEALIKIESTYLEEKGGEFINLALDIKKLTQQIKDKSGSINDHRSLLSAIIAKNIQGAGVALATQETTVRSTLGNTAASIAELEAANLSFSRLGSTISVTSNDNANRLSQIVQSMQFHDIFRQQVEHVIEALEGLLPSLSDHNFSADDQAEHTLAQVIGRAGDVCELQEAQLQFASAELHEAVTSIVSNLSDISGQQKLLAQDIYSHSGTSKGNGKSFIDDVSFHMASITELLTTCAGTNSALAGIMQEVTETVAEITGFVSDVEEIGDDINLIALNARIKAASTGPEGASLCVLAEEIGRLSHGEVERTSTITVTLTEIHTTTSALFAATKSGETNLTAKLIDIKAALHDILAIFANMGTELLALLAQIQGQVKVLNKEIERITSGIDVHERSKSMADEVLVDLQHIFGQARGLHPASEAFKEDLRLMASRYTMESERRIHEDIARKHGVLTESVHAQTTSSPTSDSEFGDNVDLF